MKKTLILLCICICMLASYAQDLPDSVLTKYHAAKTSEDKGRCLVAYLATLSIKDSQSTKTILNLISTFQIQNDAVGEDYANLRLIQVLRKNGDFSGALKMGFEMLSHFEKRNDTYGIYLSHIAISNIYFSSMDYDQSISYDKNALAFISPEKDGKAAISRIYNAIGCTYGESGHPDSGMVYAQKAVNIDMEEKNYQQLALSISTLAENYIAAKDYEIALPFLRKSLSYYESKQAVPNPYLFSYLMNDFAQVFLATHQIDSAITYAHKALSVSIPNQVKEQNMRAYEYLYKCFEVVNHQDSVNIYFRLAMTTKDSIFSIEKAKSIEALSFQEQIRQQEFETERIKAEEERSENIQFALIALGIVTFIILFFLISHSIIVNEKWISFFGILGLLIVFEFINLLIHPFLERVTHHSPVLMLLALVAIASLLIPLHHRMEKWITEKMTEKNKKIRLENARKTIEQLEER